MRAAYAFVLLLAVLLDLWPCAHSKANALDCHDFVQQYLKQRGGALSTSQDPSKLLFFLHVPRTAGKTYYTCFLKSAYPPSKRCARSYDFLRLNISVPDCTLLSSHDDMSISDLFPPDAAVITQLRKPLDRVLSTYEFAIEVAARYVHLDDDNPVFAPKNDITMVSTLRVWPWSYLVPWFRRDIQQRMETLREQAEHDNSRPHWLSFKDPQNRTYYWSAETNKSVWTLPSPKPTLDPYNNPLVTPLHEWIELPIARDVVHETALLQILGLTNYSHWPEHAAGRECLFNDAAAREALLGLAMRRLVGMKHVGLTEKLDQSVLSLAASLGLKMGDHAYKYASAQAFSYDHPTVDQSTFMTYNSSIHGSNVTVPLRVARERLVWLSGRHMNLSEELQVMVPKLSQLIEKEEEWLDQQEAAAANSSATEAPEVAVGGSLVKEVEGESQQDGDGETTQAAPTALGSAGHGKPALRRVMKSTTEVVAKKKAKKRWNTPPDHPEPGSSKGTSAEGAGAGSEQKEPQEQQQQQQHIDSPWAQEIEELDPKVADMQGEVKRIEWDMWSIQVSGGIRNSEDALGPALQILPDEHFRLHTTLGASYKQCTEGTHGRHTASQSRVMKHVVTPWRESFAFEKKARARIPQHVLDRILELNSADVQLWDLGDKLLTARIAEQQAAGVLESLERQRPRHMRRRRPGNTVTGSDSSSGDEGSVEAKHEGSASDGESHAVEDGEGQVASDDAYARGEL